jgi:hypothetical protein
MKASIPGPAFAETAAADPSRHQFLRTVCHLRSTGSPATPPAWLVHRSRWFDSEEATRRSVQNAFEAAVNAQSTRRMRPLHDVPYE